MTFDGTAFHRFGRGAKLPCVRSALRIRVIDAEIAGSDGSSQGRRPIGGGFADSDQGVLDAPLNGAAGALRGRAGTSGATSQAHRAPQLGAKKVDLLAGPCRAAGVSERLGFRERLAQILETAAVFRPRFVIQQLAGIAAVDRLVV